jgi:peroxiredoxin
MKMISWVLLLIFGLFFSETALTAAPSYPPQVGDAHPDFILPQIDSRQPVSLSQFRGKKVLLINFASW